MRKGAGILPILPKFIRDRWKDLSFRLLAVVFCTVLPLNIFIIVVSGLNLTNFTNELTQAYERELDSGMTDIENRLTDLAHRIDSYFRSEMENLTIAGKNDAFVGHDLIYNLNELLDYAEIRGISYVYDRSTGELSIKPSLTHYNDAQSAAIEESICAEFPLNNDSAWRMKLFGERIFYYRTYKYENYNMGILIDLEKTLQALYEKSFWQEKELFITDGKQIVRVDNGEFIWEEKPDWKVFEKEQPFYRSVIWKSYSLGIRTCLRMKWDRFMMSIPMVYWLLLLASVSFILLTVVLWKTIKRRVIEPLGTLSIAMSSLEKGERDYRIEHIDEDESLQMKYLFKAFNYMAQEVQDSYDKDIKMVQTQFDNLRLQVNPHMLLNSFNMIYSLAQLKNYEVIQNFSLYLVDYFRYILKETDDFVTLEKEMKFVKSYVGIQKIRFPGAFTSVYHMQEGTEKALIPPLLVGNFVENAMKYALIPGQTIEVLINIRREDEKLLISVCDTGNGINPNVLTAIKSGEVYVDKAGNKHIGIWNCRRRMEVFYGTAAKMNIISGRGAGTQVWLELPFLQEEKDHETFNRG